MAAASPVHRLFCPKCGKNVPVTPSRSATIFVDSCKHQIRVMLVPLSDAKAGMQFCFDNALDLVATAKILRTSNREHALFMLLTAYEEMAKCACILEAAHYGTNARKTDISLERFLFMKHASKYAVTIGYLKYSLHTLDLIRQRYLPGIAKLDTPSQRALLDQVAANGANLRKQCLYVNYVRRWIPCRSSSPNNIDELLGILEIMISEFRVSLMNWPLAIS